MSHNSITDDYLVGVARRGPRTSEVLDVVRDSTLDTTFLGRSLSRPCFLDYAQVSRLTRDLDQLRTSLTGLPDRLFAGDMAALARAIGTTETQAAAVVRGRGETPPRIGRADFFLDEVGFRLMEINWGPSTSCTDCS
jgi:hypothetical protein